MKPITQRRIRTRALVADTFATLAREVDCSAEELGEMGYAEWLRRRAIVRAPGECETLIPPK